MATYCPHLGEIEDMVFIPAATFLGLMGLKCTLGLCLRESISNIILKLSFSDLQFSLFKDDGSTRNFVLHTAFSS